MAMGGLPAVLIGSLVLNSLDQKAMSRPVLVNRGADGAAHGCRDALAQLVPKIEASPVALKWLPWIVAPIGFEVGFSSAGAGALGTIVLMRYTSLLPAEVVGTDLAFGLLLSIFAGGIHASMTGVPWAILGETAAGWSSGGADRNAVDFRVIAPQNAPGAVRLAGLYRRAAVLAGHWFRDTQRACQHQTAKTRWQRQAPKDRYGRRVVADPAPAGTLRTGSRRREPSADAAAWSGRLRCSGAGAR